MDRKYWTLLQALPAAEITRIVREAEDSGLDGIWSPQLFAPPFPTMAAAAMVSSRIKLGSGIALAFTRTPLETALNALDLDIISSGRVVLGLGTSVRNFNETYHGVTYGKPVAHLREVVGIVRQVIERGHTGELEKFAGTYHQVDLRGFKVAKPRRSSIPIYLPGLFEATIAMAAEIGDGLMGHPIWSASWTENQVTTTMGKALRDAGRSRDKFHVNLWVYTAMANDRKQAIDDARGTVAFYSSIAQYAKYYQAHGFGAQARAACEAARRGDYAAMVKAIPDEMVTTFAVAGTREDAQQRIENLWRFADSITLVPPTNIIEGAKVAAYRSAIAETFFRG